MAAPVVTSIDSLPKEIWQRTIELLEQTSLVHIFRTSKYFNAIVCESKELTLRKNGPLFAVEKREPELGVVDQRDIWKVSCGGKVLRGGLFHASFAIFFNKPLQVPKVGLNQQTLFR